jgi:putative tryptophan/tyrosine transport system substrate-binding protein
VGFGPARCLRPRRRCTRGRLARLAGRFAGSEPLLLLGPKQLQLLRELMPNASMFGVLADPAFPATPSVLADLQAAARTLGLQLVVVNASPVALFATQKIWTADGRNGSCVTSNAGPHGGA